MRVNFDKNNDYDINHRDYSEEVNKGLSEASRKVAELGDRETGY